MIKLLLICFLMLMFCLVGCASTPPPQLRSTPGIYSKDDIKLSVIQKNLQHFIYNTYGDFPNEYELKIINGDKIVVDHNSRLMWGQSGSNVPYKWDSAESIYIATLNKNSFAGYSDWRVPTLEELLSLAEVYQGGDNLVINSIFNTASNAYWSADKSSKQAAWAVSYTHGSFDSYLTVADLHVRAVRTMEDHKIFE
jgi:hypothetical protein